MIPEEKQFYKIGIKEGAWLFLCFVILMPDALVHAVLPGLDPSWELSISMALHKHFVWGKDYLFTYGPLGFLYTKQTVVVSKWIILSFELLMSLGCLWMAWQVLRNSGYHLLCYLMVPLAFSLWKIRNDSFINAVPVLFLFFILVFFQTKRLLLLLAAMALSVISFYIKINFGFVLFFFCYATLAVAGFKKNLTFTQCLIAVSFHVLTFVLISFIIEVDLPGYIKSSLHLINAYNDAMYLYIRLNEAYLVIALIIVFLYGVGFLLFYKYYLKNFLSLVSYLFVGVFLFLYFKNGYVRADNAHYPEYFRMCVTLFGLMYFISEGTIKKSWAILSCLVLTLSFGVFWKEDALRLSLKLKMEYYRDIVTDVSFKNKLQEESEFPIPAEYIHEIGQNTVDILPVDIAELYRYGLNYDPRPVIQSYSAYDEYLDGKNYEKYTARSAPDYLLYSLWSIDGRYAFWDESMTKRAMLTHYELVNRDSAFQKPFVFEEQNYLAQYADVREAVRLGQQESGYVHYQKNGRREGRRYGNAYLLFRKRQTSLQDQVIRTDTITMTMNREFKLRDAENILYLYASVNYNIKGKLMRLFYQPPPLYVVFKYEDGSTMRYKAIVPILKTGVLISHRVDDRYSAGAFFQSQGKKREKIISVELQADYGFDPVIPASIKEVKIK